MRWPFRRSQPEASRPAAGPASRGEWATVASLRPTIAEAPLVAPSRPFVDETHGARSLVLPRPMLAGRRDLEPPPGIVTGVAVSTGLESTTDLALLPQLPTGETRDMRAALSATALATEPAPPVAYEPPVPLLPVVTAAPVEAAKPFVTSDLVLAPRHLVQPAPSDGVEETPVLPGRPGRTISRAPAPTVAHPQADEVEPLEELAPAPAVPARRRPSVGQSRRFGIGPPVPVPSPTAQEPSAEPPPPQPPAPPPLTPQQREESPLVTLAPPAAAPEEEEVEPPLPPRLPPMVPRRRGRVGAPLTPDEIAPARAAVPPPAAPVLAPRVSRPVVEPVPADLRDVVRRRTGVDVGDVLVHRDEQSAAEARQLGARAFARDGEVSLPPERGSVDDRGTRGLLAHELTHVAQQRQFGSSLPLEHTPLGRRLEAQARKVEREVSGEQQPQRVRIEPPPPPPPPEPAYQGPTDFVVARQAEAFQRAANELIAMGAVIDADGALVFDPDLALEAAGIGGVQRALFDDVAESATSMVSSFVPSAEQAAAGFAHEAEGFAAHALQSEFRPAEQALGPEGGAVVYGVEHAAGGLLTGGEHAATLFLGTAEHSLASLLGGTPGHTLEAGASAYMTETEPAPSAGAEQTPVPSGEPPPTGFTGYDPEIMFRQLYRRMHQQLRRDMLLERERSGSLANSH